MNAAKVGMTRTDCKLVNSDLSLNCIENRQAPRSLKECTARTANKVQRHMDPLTVTKYLQNGQNSD